MKDVGLWCEHGVFMLTLIFPHPSHKIFKIIHRFCFVPTLGNNAFLVEHSFRAIQFVAVSQQSHSTGVSSKQRLLSCCFKWQSYSCDKDIEIFLWLFQSSSILRNSNCSILPAPPHHKTQETSKRPVWRSTMCILRRQKTAISPTVGVT